MVLCSSIRVVEMAVLFLSLGAGGYGRTLERRVEGGSLKNEGFGIEACMACRLEGDGDGHGNVR